VSPATQRQPAEVKVKIEVKTEACNRSYKIAQMSSHSPIFNYLVKDGIKCIQIQISIALGTNIFQTHHKYKYLSYLRLQRTGYRRNGLRSFWFLGF
jgi:hypothetical protein